MKKLHYIFLLLVIAVFTFSCEDENLDPLQLKKVKKGRILALRGTMLQNIYFLGKPAAEVFPRIATANDKFEFETEYLAPDPESLESVDVYVIKKTGATTSRELVKNVPASEFKNDGKYPNPWATISVPLADIMTKLGLDNTVPFDAPSVTALLTTYKTGISIECDINLTDGTQVLAADIVAAGLFQSNQFYPAMRLTYTVTDYCSYDQNSWGGDYDATETSDFYGGYGPYTISLVQDGTNKNKYSTDNWYDSGIPIYMEFSASTNVATQVVTVPLQEYQASTLRTIEATGKYNQCLNIITLNFVYKVKSTGDVLDQLIWKLVKKPA